MAARIVLVSKAEAEGQQLVNGVREVLINADDGQTDAATIQEAVDACNAVFPADANGSNAFPVGYFDTVEAVSTVALLDTDEDAIVFVGGGHAALRNIAA